MADQCNNCGGFEKLDVCMHCTTVVCEHCRPNHAPLCEELEKRKRRNQGPTVANTPVPQHRRGHAVPPTTGPDRLVFIPSAAPTAPESDVNSGLMGVHDLLKGE